MKDNKLISMTDFVIQQRSELMFKELGKACCKYADFLKQPLKLGMFVPVDEIGEVMDYEEIKQSVIEGTDSWDAYEIAKENVLFEGFRILDNEEQVFCTLGMGKLIITYDYKTKTFLLQKDWTVERLVRFSLILTPTAINQIQS